MKVCSKCNEELQITAFSKNKATKDGLFAWCKKCVHEYNIRPEIRIRERRRENTQRYKKYDREYANTKVYNNWTREHIKFLWQEYHIIPEIYDLILEDQNGVCAICGNLPKGKRLCVDHNHDTDEIRGLLCDKCNQAIGLFKDNPEYMMLAAEYVQNKDVV